MPDSFRQKIQEIFSQVVELPTAERHGFLSEVCGSNDHLRREVLALLKADEKASDFIEKPVFASHSLSKNLYAAPEKRSANQDSMIGKTIGAYKIEREIGAGGMGTVYLASRADGEFQQKVAVKLIKPGLHTQINLDRFRQERQILAALDHPNIARLLDGGTTEDNLPYLILEFIEGKPLFEYCDSKDLDLRERLLIFRLLCQAAAAAHERQIIHRDIKPGNVLITNEGVPKLLDFGIAKILDPDMIHEAMNATATFMQLMTPEYASPEQARGEKVMAATDIYSLGVLLYELVTGERPYDFGNRSAYEIARVICENAPRRPSSIKNEKANDRAETFSLIELDKIIFKALQKTPEKRYKTVQEFIADIELFLDNKPVLATNEIWEDETSILHFETQSPVTSLIIIPFRFISGGKTDPAGGRDYKILGIGLADTLASRLSGLQQIHIRPTSSVLRLIEQNLEIFDIGNKLAADFAVDGHILQIGSRMRVSVQLLRISDHSIVWAGQFDESETDFFRLLEYVSEKVTDALLPQLSTEQQNLMRRVSHNKAALDAYLRGRYQWHTYTLDGINESIVFFHEAVAHDPNFALAYAGIADYYNWVGVAGLLPPEECFSAAKNSARKAIEIDDQLGEAYASLAFAVWTYDRDSKTAENLFLRAIELNPNYAPSHEWYAYLLSSQARHDEAIARFNIAEKLDPNSPSIISLFSLSLFNARRFAEAQEKNRRALELNPEYYVALQASGWICTDPDKMDEAIANCRRAVAKVDQLGFNKWTLAVTLAIAGKKDEAREIAGELEKLSLRQYVPPYYFALIYANLGEPDEAFRWLEKALEKRDYWLNFLSVEPRFDALRKDPRFETVLRKISQTSDVKIEKDPTSAKFEHKTVITAPINEKSEKFSRKNLFAFAVVLLIFASFGTAFYFGVLKIGNGEKQVLSRQAGISNLPKTLVVLPFSSGDSEDQTLGVGLADALSGSLGTIKQISVREANNGVAFVEEKPNVIGKKFDASFVLRGSLQKSEGKLQITAELARTDTDEILWKDRFSSVGDDLLKAQRDISDSVVKALEIQLTTKEREYIVRRHTRDNLAYQLYLNGLNLSNKRSVDDLEKAIRFYSEAVKRDPEFALGYAGLADANIAIARIKRNDSDALYKEAEKLALKALSIDENLAEAHTTLGIIYFSNREPFDKPISHLRRAIEINPSYSQVYQAYASLLIYAGDYEQALLYSKKAAELEPNRANARTILATNYIYLRRFDEAIAECNKAREIDPSFAPAYLNLRFAYQAKGDYRAALEAEERAEIFAGYKNEIERLQTASTALAASGEREESLKTVKRLMETNAYKQEPESFAYEIALTHALLGDYDKSLEFLKRARKDFIPTVDPRFDPFLSDPHFRDFFSSLKKKSGV